MPKGSRKKAGAGATRKAANATRKAAPKKAAAAPSRGGSGWASDVVFNVREAKQAVSLRLDADVLRFFRGFGAGYQTRINEVLRAFMDSRQGSGSSPAGRKR